MNQLLEISRPEPRINFLLKNKTLATLTTNGLEFNVTDFSHFSKEDFALAFLYTISCAEFYAPTVFFHIDDRQAAMTISEKSISLAEDPKSLHDYYVFKKIKELFVLPASEKTSKFKNNINLQEFLSSNG